MLGGIGAALGGLGNAISGIFGFKKSKVEVISESVKLLNTIEMSDGQRDVAMASILAAEASSDGWLTRSWRPIVYLGLYGIIIFYWFGYVPPHLLDENIPPMMEKLLNIAGIILTSAIVTRSIDKVAKGVNLGQLIKGYIKK